MVSSVYVWFILVLVVGSRGWFVWFGLVTRAALFPRAPHAHLHATYRTPRALPRTTLPPPLHSLFTHTVGWITLPWLNVAHGSYRSSARSAFLVPRKSMRHTVLYTSGSLWFTFPGYYPPQLPIPTTAVRFQRSWFTTIWFTTTIGFGSATFWFGSRGKYGYTPACLRSPPTHLRCAANAAHSARTEAFTRTPRTRACAPTSTATFLVGGTPELRFGIIVHIRFCHLARVSTHLHARLPLRCPCEGRGGLPPSLPTHTITRTAFYHYTWFSSRASVP